MKKIILLLLSGCSLQSIGQTPVPDYGTISTDEISMKECAFDKEAEAVLLLDKAVATYDDQKHLITQRRIKFKILTENGLNRGNLRIVYYSADEFETINDLEAYVCNTNANGQISKTIVDKKSIFTNKINELFSEIKIALPDIKKGSIIEYKYTSDAKSFYSALRDWSFQTDIPTLISQYDLTILPGVAFTYKMVKSRLLNIDVKSFKNEGRVVFEMKNIAGLREEPFMDAPEDYRQRIIFQLSEYRTYYGTKEKVANTWPELARFLLQDDEFGKAIDKNIKGADELIASANLLPDEYAKMNAIYSYVRKGFNWNGIYSKYAREGLKKIWDRKNGNTGELNLLLINLLREAKLDAHPLLVSERDHGKVDGSYPFLDQFNKVVAIVLINGKRYILDATDQYTPADMIPFDLLNTNAFIVSKKSDAVLALTDESRMLKNFTGILSEISENGIITGNVSVISYDYSKLNRTIYYRKKNKEQFISNYFRNEVSNIEIDSFEINNLQSDSLPLDQKFHFSAAMPASGEYRMVNLNLFGGMEKSPFVSDNRFTNINFGSQLLQNTTQVVKIPATIKPDAIPKNMNLVMPDNSIILSRLVDYNESKNIFTIRIKWQIKRTVFTPDEYPSIKEFYKKMVELLNEPLVLKKK